MRPPLLTRAKTLRDIYSYWMPHPGPQSDFLASKAFELLYGGAAGGGKSVGMLADAATQSHLQDYAAILFRKTYKQLEEAGGLVPRSRELYPHLGARYRAGEYKWVFPAGSQIVLRHLQHSADRYNYQGAEYAYIGFDQLEQFGEEDYLYLFSRSRTPNLKIRKLVRATANPGADWILRRWLPWLGTDEELAEQGMPRAKAGEILYFKRDNDVDQICAPDDPEGLSRTFIPATIYDNPTLMINDPDYIVRLKALPMVERRRLLDSDWHIRASSGNLFRREWLSRFVDHEGDLARVARGFDLASSEQETASDNPDYTASVLMGTDDRSQTVILDALQERLSPFGVENLLTNLHETEPKSIDYVFEQDPGQAGKSQMFQLRRLLRGRRLISVIVSKDKVTRAGPLSSDAEGGLVILKRGAWNNMYVNHLINFPDPSWKDDLVDASSVVHTHLTSGPKKAKVVRLGG